MRSKLSLMLTGLALSAVSFPAAAALVARKRLTKSAQA